MCIRDSCCQELRFVQVVNVNNKGYGIDPPVGYIRRRVDREPFYSDTNTKGRYGHDGTNVIWPRFKKNVKYDLWFEDSPWTPRAFTVGKGWEDVSWRATLCLVCVTKGREPTATEGGFRILRCIEWGYDVKGGKPMRNPEMIRDLGADLPGGKDGYFTKALNDFNTSTKGKKDTIQWHVD